jgi:hypothetical protein
VSVCVDPKIIQQYKNAIKKSTISPSGYIDNVVVDDETEREIDSSVDDVVVSDEDDLENVLGDQIES